MPALTGVKLRYFNSPIEVQAFINGNLHAFPQGPALSSTDTDTVNTVISLSHDTTSGKWVLFYT